jgi:hypothetical protein
MIKKGKSMKSQTRKSPVLFVVLSLAILALATTACSYHHPLQMGELHQVVDISLDEELFHDAQPGFTIHDHDFWEDLDVDVDRMELHDGYLRFLGTKLMPDGSRANCSIDVVLGAQNGDLTANIIAVDIPGMELTDPKVVAINQEMEVEVSLNDLDPDATILFQDVEVTEDALRIKVQVNIKF